MAKTKKSDVKARGPKPDALKIEGNWRDAIKKTLDKKKPPNGWPK